MKQLTIDLLFNLFFSILAIRILFYGWAKMYYLKRPESRYPRNFWSLNEWLGICRIAGVGMLIIVIIRWMILLVELLQLIRPSATR